MQDHAAVGRGGAAVAQEHLDAVVDFSTRHLSRDGKHVDNGDVHPILLSAGS